MGAIIKLIEMRYRPADAPGQWTPLPPVPPGSATVNVPLEPGRQYVIQARSVAACGAVSPWAEVNHTPASPSKAPKPPTNPAAEGMADGVHVSWTIGDKRANIVSEINWAYDVNNTPDATWFALPEASGASTIHRVTDGVERWYRMRHVDYLGNVSPWTTEVKAKPKTVADGADITAENAVPNGISVGGFLAKDIKINFYQGVDDPGEVSYVGGEDTFIHPDGTVYELSNLATLTHLESVGQEHGWLAFVAGDLSRFGGLTENFLLVKKIGRQWHYSDNTTWQPFNPIAADCIIAAVEKILGDAGISRIHRFAKRYDSYTDGTQIDQLRPAEPDSDKTSNHLSKGNDLPGYSGWITGADLRATYGKGIFSESIDDPTDIGLPADVGAGVVLIGIGGFSYPPGVALTFQSDAGATWVSGELADHTFSDWAKQFNASDGNKPDLAKGDVENAGALASYDVVDYLTQVAHAPESANNLVIKSQFEDGEVGPWAGVGASVSGPTLSHPSLSYYLRVSFGINIISAIRIPVRPGEKYYLAADSFITSGGAGNYALALRCVDAAGNTVNYEYAFFDSTAHGWRLIGGIDTFGIVTIPDGVVAAYPSIFTPSGDGYVALNNLVCVPAAQVLSEAGSGARLGDARNQAMVTVGNYGSAWEGMALSYTADSSGNFTITATAATLHAGSAPIAYNSASLTLAGTPGNSYTEYMYYLDPDYSGGTKALQHTVNFNSAIDGDGKLYIGKITCNLPTSGSGGGGGQTPCPVIEAWVIRRAADGGREFIRAGQVRVNDYLLLTDGRWGRVSFSARRLADCVRVSGESGYGLSCSTTAPLELAEGGDVLAPQALAARIRAFGAVDADRINSVTRLGKRWVQHITCEFAFFWAGDDVGCLFGHHNMKPTN